MVNFNTRPEVLDIIDTVYMQSTALPTHVEEIMVDVKARFELMDSVKGLYWKETSNGILSVNRDSIMLIREDGTTTVIFDQGLDGAPSEHHSELCTWLYMYCMVWPLQALKEDSFLMGWIEENYKEV